MSPFSVYLCRLNIYRAIEPCPVCLCLASQKRNNLIQGRDGMRSRKGEGREGEVSLEEMNRANTCFIRLNITFMFLVTTF